MRTRVRPHDPIQVHNWYIEVFDVISGHWIHNSNHYFFWKANLKAYLLSKMSLNIKENSKEKFVDRLKNGNE